MYSCLQRRWILISSRILNSSLKSETFSEEKEERAASEKETGEYGNSNVQGKVCI